MRILVPNLLTEAMLISSTVAEPAAGETLWVPGGTYGLGDKRIRTATHRIYECVVAHTARTALPENDPTYWEDIGPTNRWAVLDDQESTQTAIATPLTMVMRPGFFNALGIYGMDGATLDITVKDAPAGTTIFSQTTTLQAPPIDWYDWAFGQIRPLTKLIVSDIVPYPDAELTISLTAPAGVTVKAGMLIVGDLRDLLDQAVFGGTEYGATADLVDFSYIKTDDFGNTKIKKRRSATDMTAKVFLPLDVASTALAAMRSVLATPVAFIATQAPGYEDLNVFGLGTASLSYDSPIHATLSIKVKGMIE